MQGQRMVAGLRITRMRQLLFASICAHSRFVAYIVTTHAARTNCIRELFFERLHKKRRTPDQMGYVLAECPNPTGDIAPFMPSSSCYPIIRPNCPSPEKNMRRCHRMLADVLFSRTQFPAAPLLFSNFPSLSLTPFVPLFYIHDLCFLARCACHVLYLVS